MAKIVYTLKKKQNTKELHLFEGEMTTTGCPSKFLSICKKMKNSEQDGNNIFQCEDENISRIKCAEKGKSVCGICVSHLYETY